MNDAVLMCDSINIDVSCPHQACSQDWEALGQQGQAREAHCALAHQGELYVQTDASRDVGTLERVPRQGRWSSSSLLEADGVQQAAVGRGGN